jgi:hypothetical protein
VPRYSSLDGVTWNRLTSLPNMKVTPCTVTTNTLNLEEVSARHIRFDVFPNKTSWLDSRSGGVGLVAVRLQQLFPEGC